jgi:hypothetical protein
MENGAYIRVAVRSPEDNLRLCAALTATLDREHACPSRPFRRGIPQLAESSAACWSLKTFISMMA